MEGKWQLHTGGRRKVSVTREKKDRGCDSSRAVIQYPRPSHWSPS